jgi:CubicO group peptidase (beta-lactamase class C family)
MNGLNGRLPVRVRSRLRGRVVAWVTLATGLALPVAGQTPAQRAAIERFGEQLKTDVAADNVGAITAGVMLNGKLVWAKGFGFADRERKIAAGPETIYRIGSISKSFTAVALMQAVQRGEMSLDEPLHNYLPEATGFGNPKADAQPPTLRQFASHTAGLIREPTLPNAAAGPIEEWENKVLASIPKTSFDHAPGSKYAYSNIGFGVLGLAVSRAARAPFMKLVEDGIFRPLGMRSSTFIIDDRLRPNLAVGYEKRRDGTIDANQPALEHKGRGYKVPNGGIYSTVGDLARFAAAMSGINSEVILNEKNRQEMMRVQTPEDPGDGYGLGFSINTEPDGRRIVSHGGSVAGYTAYLAFDPDAKAAVILLRNYGAGATNLGRVSNQLLRELVAGYPVPKRANDLVRR